MTDPVVIAGAGVAGCGLALGLHRAGIPCVVHEARSAGEEAGAFLALASSGVRALRALGAEDAVASVSEPVTVLRTLDDDGASVGERSLAGPDAPGYRLLTRGALARALAGLVAERGVGVRYGAGVRGARPDRDAVDVELADGSSTRGALLIGADGIGSAVRSLVDPGSSPRPVGQRIYYGTTPRRELGEPGDFIVQRTPTGMFGAFPRDDVTWWFLRRDAEPDEAPDDDPAVVAVAHAPTGGPARDTVADAADVVTFDAHDLAFVGSWYRSRMLLVGDAAHAASPATGQGASMALEDVVVLAKALRDHPGEAGAAAATYERARRGRTQANVLASAAMSRPDRPVTGADPGARLSEDALVAQLTWE